MLSNLMILCVAVLAGAVMPLQAGINSQLSIFLGKPFQAALVSFLGGSLVMLIGCLVSSQGLPSWMSLTKAPPHLLIGGFLGSILVFTSIILAPKLGATVLISCLIAGQLVTSVVLDHHGWAGFPVHHINIWRMIGVMFLLAGMFLVKFF